MPDQQSIVTLDNISKIYTNQQERLTVLDKVSITIQPATFTAIVGPSGSGKSTLLHIMGLLDSASEGELAFKGQDVRKIPPRTKARLRNEHIGFIFQSYHLLAELTALENILLPAQLKKTHPDIAREKARELLERVHLTSRESHRPNALSGGEQQRVCICRALINEPELVLADEPTGNLDSHNAAEVENLLATLAQEQGTALVIVTHNEKLAAKANNRVALFDGKILDSSVR